MFDEKHLSEFELGRLATSFFPLSIIKLPGVPSEILADVIYQDFTFLCAT